MVTANLSSTETSAVAPRLSLQCEAIAADTPVLCSAIPGNLGLLGADWPGAFPAGDVDALAALLERAADDRAFLDDLCARTRALQPMVAPSAERDAWRQLLTELGLC